MRWRRCHASWSGRDEFHDLTTMRKSFLAVILPAVLLISGCATFPGWMPGAGASREQVQQEPGVPSARVEGLQLVDVNNALARKLKDAKKLGQFAEVFPSNTSNNYVIGPGDLIEVTIWEAPPAMLFSTVPTDAANPALPGGASAQSLPKQMVDADGTITVPFAGRIAVKGNTTEQIEASIVRHLKGKANQPQVLVDVVKNNASNVTIVGEVNASAMMPLTPKGERLLDALAFAGGAKQTISHMAVRLSRGDVTATMPLDAVIRDPRQNIMLRPGDVVTALYQPESFTVLGATGKNDEIPFEAQGISLAQALARSGGLADNRADARGIFVFRFEDPRLVEHKEASVQSVNGAVPVVYEIDLRDPGSFFVTQNFPIQNHDLIYVSNAPGAEFSKFLSYLVTVAAPAAAITYDLNR
jgi:polysaccharide biosynthesis/export protein